LINLLISIIILFMKDGGVAYPFMFSKGEDEPMKGLPECYRGNPYFCYEFKEENFFDDSNFYGNPFESMREEKESDNYSVLGLKRSASDEDIKAAFREKALETHPDKGGDPEDFRKVREAYECLVC
jgi:hypothetical protein